MACNLAHFALHLLRSGRKLAPLVLILSACPVLSQSGDVLPQRLPQITGVQWNPVAAGGTQCAIGTGFGDLPGLISFNGAGVTPSQWSDTQVCFVIPPDTATGTASLLITIDDLAASVLFTVTAAPSMNGVNPFAGAGMAVTISGANFDTAQNGSKVRIAGQDMQIAGWSDTQIVAIVPPKLAPNSYTLNVTIRGFTATTSLKIVARPEIFFVLTDPVGITGTECVWGVGFDTVPGVIILNGTVLSPSSWSLFQACFAVPANIAAGTVSLQVMNAAGASNVINFVVTTAVPAISNVTPAGAGPGEPVAISGTNFGDFQADSLFQIQGQNFTVTRWSNTQIVGTVPFGIATGVPGSVDVTVHGVTVSAALAVVNPSLDADILNRIAGVDAVRIGNNIQTLANFGTRNSCSDNSGGTQGIGAARDFIYGQFSSLPGMRVSFVNFTVCNANPIQDVIAWIPGSGHPNRLIVIGGHYDSRTLIFSDGTSPAPGANDSGSQTAAVLEAARVLAGRSYDATIVFAAWAGEEQGLLGSGAFLFNLRALFPDGVVEFNLNCDIVGGDNTVNTAANLLQFRLFSPGTPRETSSTAVGSTDNTSPSRLIMHYIGDWGSRYVPEMSMLPNLREDRPNRGSDHESFIANSIPGVRFIETVETLAHQHNPNDRFDFVTPAYTARITRVVAATAAALAQAPTPPRSFRATMAGDGTITATWLSPFSGPSADHFAIAARPVTENFYHQRVQVSPSQNSAQVRMEDLGIAPGVSFFISVSAVDAFGHESPFGYPEYRCTPTFCTLPAGALNVTATR